MRQELSRYTDAVWLFPFGAAPDLRAPVQVFRNGVAQWVGEEAQLVMVGARRPTAVVLLDPPAREGDVLQATYVTRADEVGR